MSKLILPLALALSAALAGCNQDNQIVSGPPDDMAGELANAAPVELPPAIAASKSYRCKDNSLIYIDWLSDGSARVKKDRNELGTPVPAGDASLQGDAQAASISYNGQSCKA